MGRRRAYTARQLEKAVTAYFRRLTRTVSVKELVDSGERDKYGHPILVQMEIRNDDGEVVKVEEFVEPPTVGGLCRALGISTATWERYCKAELHPELAEVTERARDVFKGYLERELLRRPGKELPGVIFNLKANYGMSEKQELRVSGGDGRLQVVFGGGESEFE